MFDLIHGRVCLRHRILVHEVGCAALVAGAGAVAAGQELLQLLQHIGRPELLRPGNVSCVLQTLRQRSLRGLLAVLVRVEKLDRGSLRDGHHVLRGADCFFEAVLLPGLQRVADQGLGPRFVRQAGLVLDGFTLQ